MVAMLALALNADQRFGLLHEFAQVEGAPSYGAAPERRAEPMLLKANEAEIEAEIDKGIEEKSRELLFPAATPNLANDVVLQDFL